MPLARNAGLPQTGNAGLLTCKFAQWMCRSRAWYWQTLRDAALEPVRAEIDEQARPVGLLKQALRL